MNLKISKSIYFLFCVFFAISFLSVFGQSKYSNDPSIRRDPTGYKLRAGDVVSIIVSGEPETKTDATLDIDGFIKPVYLEEIKIVGLSVKEIEKKLIFEYKNNLIYKNPYVKVYIKKYSERVVYLSGSVVNKGPFIFPPEVEAMNIVEVIARAGGFNAIAQKKRVFVTRTFYDRNGNTKDTQTYEVNVDALSVGSVSNLSTKRFGFIQVTESKFPRG